MEEGGRDYDPFVAVHACETGDNGTQVVIHVQPVITCLPA